MTTYPYQAVLAVLNKALELKFLSTAYAPKPAPRTIPAFLNRCVGFLGGSEVFLSDGVAREVELKRG